MADDPKPVTIDLTAALTEMQRAETLADGAVSLINTLAGNSSAAVTAALTAKGITDQGVIDAATAAIEAERVKLASKNDAVAAALANTPDGTPVPQVPPADPNQP